MKTRTMDDNCETPNRREQSLRSRTVTSFKKDKSTRSTDCKKLMRHKSVEGKSLGHSLNSFSSLPSFKTPPSAVKKSFPINPFNVGLRERLMSSTVSPNIFSNVLSPSQDSEEMRWTIEDISLIKPAPIDENFQPLPEPDDVQDMQEVINKYFLETHLPSPFDAPRNCISRESAETPPLVKMCKQAVASTPRVETDGVLRSREVYVQTALSLPPTLPEHVEAVLKPFLNTMDRENAEAAGNSLNASSMRRKLFFHQGDEQLSPVRFNSETIFQKTEPFTPTNSSQSRHFTPITSSQELAQPDISPILMDRSSSSSITCKSRTRLSFTDSPDHQIRKNSSRTEKKREDCDHIMDANSLIDEPMTVSVIDVLKVSVAKKRSSSDGDVKPRTSTSYDKDFPSTSAVMPSISDVGYCTNEDMSWRQSTNDKGKNLNHVPISFLAASTPSKEKTNETF